MLTQHALATQCLFSLMAHPGGARLCKTAGEENTFGPLKKPALGPGASEPPASTGASSAADNGLTSDEKALH